MSRIFTGEVNPCLKIAICPLYALAVYKGGFFVVFGEEFGFAFMVMLIEAIIIIIVIADSIISFLMFIFILYFWQKQALYTKNRIIFIFS